MWLTIWMACQAPVGTTKEPIAPGTTPAPTTDPTPTTTTGPTTDTAPPEETAVVADTAATDTGAPLPIPDVACVDADHVHAVLPGVASGTAILDLWETGAPHGLGWNEEHDLAPQAGDLVRDLEDTSLGGFYTRNQVSLFECTYQYANFASTLAAAVRWKDPATGADQCVMWGYDTAYVLSGQFTLYTPVTDPAGLVGCTVLP